MSDRYKVVEGSESGHCCFEATVVDTARSRRDMPTYPMCECLEREDAQRICDALNTVSPPIDAASGTAAPG